MNQPGSSLTSAMARESRIPPGSPTVERATPRFALTQEAANGALDIFVDGHLHGMLSKQIFGLTVLRDATATQVDTAMISAESEHHLTRAEIEAMIAGNGVFSKPLTGPLEGEAPAQPHMRNGGRVP